MTKHNLNHPRTRGKRLGAAALLLGATLGGSVLHAAPAHAHATAQLYGEDAHAGGYGHVFLRIPHGCDGGRATDTVTVRIPTGFTSVKPERKDGWKTRIGRNEKGRVTSVTWYDGNLPDDHFEDFGLSVKYPEKPGTYHLPTTQRCGRMSISWNQTAKPGEDAHALERPAPRIRVSDGERGTAIGKGLTTHAGRKDTGRSPSGEASILSFNGRTTLIVDLPSTLRGRIATITLESGTGNASRRSTILERTPLDTSGDLLRSYPNVERNDATWRITNGDEIVVAVGGVEMVRATVSSMKSSTKSHVKSGTQ